MRTAALRKSGWSSISPTGSVSYSAGDRLDLDPVRAEQLDRRAQVRRAVADVGAEPEVAGPHRGLALRPRLLLLVDRRSWTTSTATSSIASGSGGSGFAARTRTDSQP